MLLAPPALCTPAEVAAEAEGAGGATQRPSRLRTLAFSTQSGDLLATPAPSAADDPGGQHENFDLQAANGAPAPGLAITLDFPAHAPRALDPCAAETWLVELVARVLEGSALALASDICEVLCFVSCDGFWVGII